MAINQGVTLLSTFAKSLSSHLYCSPEEIKDYGKRNGSLGHQQPKFAHDQCAGIIKINKERNKRVAKAVEL